METKDFSRFGSSSNGHFSITDTFSTPHPYTIGPRHVAFAADRFSGMLGREAIEAGEREGQVKCAHPGCHLKYGQHEKALFVRCAADPAQDAARAELQEYLLGIKDQVEAEGFVGFGFLKAWEE